jgi:hypothetical protein
VVAFLYITFAWPLAARLHRKYANRYPENYYASRFEDLVSDPVERVRDVCAFLDLPFGAEMLDPPKVDSSYASQRGRGFDKHALTRWQSELKPWMSAWLVLWTGPRLRQLGYLDE